MLRVAAGNQENDGQMESNSMRNNTSHLEKNISHLKNRQKNNSAYDRMFLATKCSRYFQQNDHVLLSLSLFFANVLSFT